VQTAKRVKLGEELSDETIRDTALQDFSDSIAYWSPAQAAGMVQLISNETKREQSMEQSCAFGHRRIPDQQIIGS